MRKKCYMDVVHKMCMTAMGLQVWYRHVWSPVYAFLLSQINGWGKKSLSSLNCNAQMGVSLAALPVKYEREIFDTIQYKEEQKMGGKCQGDIVTDRN